MNLKLVKASMEYKRQIIDMLEEWYASGEKIIPYGKEFGGLDEYYI